MAITVPQPFGIRDGGVGAGEIHGHGRERSRTMAVRVSVADRVRKWGGTYVLAARAEASRAVRWSAPLRLVCQAFPLDPVSVGRTGAPSQAHCA